MWWGGHASRRICPWLTKNLIPLDCQPETLVPVVFSQLPRIILMRRLFIREPP